MLSAVNGEPSTGRMPREVLLEQRAVRHGALRPGSPPGRRRGSGAEGAERFAEDAVDEDERGPVRVPEHERASCARGTTPLRRSPAANVPCAIGAIGVKRHSSSRAAGNPVRGEAFAWPRARIGSSHSGALGRGECRRGASNSCTNVSVMTRPPPHRSSHS